MIWLNTIGNILCINMRYVNHVLVLLRFLSFRQWLECRYKLLFLLLTQVLIQLLIPNSSVRNSGTSKSICKVIIHLRPKDSTLSELLTGSPPQSICGPFRKANHKTMSALCTMLDHIKSCRLKLLRTTNHHLDQVTTNRALVLIADQKRRWDINPSSIGSRTRINTCTLGNKIFNKLIAFFRTEIVVEYGLGIFSSYGEGEVLWGSDCRYRKDKGKEWLTSRSSFIQGGNWE